MASSRRMGPQDSASSNSLLDAAERVLRDEGYAAATSRRIAEVAGLKQQLVYYYFKSMDELLLAAFRRRTQRGLERLARNLESDRPVHAFWNDYFGVDANLTFEYMALANRHDGIRNEIAAFVNKARQLQSERLAEVYREHAIANEPVSPGAAAFLMLAVSLLLRREAEIGIDAAHDDVKSVIDWCLAKFA